jgi:hypothetical protein
VLTEILAAHVNDAAGKHERTWRMQSTMMTFVRQRGCAPKTFNRMACAVIIIGLAGFAMTASPIAAGAAIGFVATATAAASAGAPPAASYCWYHSDPSRTQGFSDVCPR